VSGPASAASTLGKLTLRQVGASCEIASSARITLGEESPDRLEVDVWGDGGLLVLRRAFQPLFKASAGGRPLPILPVNLSLLGVEVPPGNHRVWIEVGAGPEILAGGIAILAFLTALVMAFPMKRLW